MQSNEVYYLRFEGKVTEEPNVIQKFVMQPNGLVNIDFFINGTRAIEHSVIDWPLHIARHHWNNLVNNGKYKRVKGFQIKN